MAKNQKNNAPKTIEKPQPYVLSINICDSIIRDESTKKVSLIGIFSTIRANTFPCTHPLMHVYVALTNGHGKCKAEVRFSHVDEQKPIAGMIGDLDFQNPLQVIELNLCWQNIIFNKPGEYIVEVLCERTQIGTRKFRVIGPQQQVPPTSGTQVV